MRRTNTHAYRPSNFDAVMAGLLTPILDADLADPELAKLERRAAREAKERARVVWHRGWLRVEEANHRHEAVRFHRLGRLAETGKNHASDLALEATAFRVWIKAIGVQMRIPAVTKDDLAWKRRHAHIREGVGSKPNPEWAALIAADEARLSRRASA